jgi:hypothetical protein
MSGEEEDPLSQTAYLEAMGITGFTGDMSKLHGQDTTQVQSSSAAAADAGILSIDVHDAKTELVSQRLQAERFVRRVLHHSPTYLDRLQRIFREPTAEMRLTYRRRYRNTLHYDEETVKRLWGTFCNLDKHSEGAVLTTQASAEFRMSFISSDKHDLSFLDVLFFLFPSRRFKENLRMFRAVAFPAVGEELMSRLWHDVYCKSLGSSIHMDLKNRTHMHTYGRVAVSDALARVQRHKDLLVFTRYLHLKIDMKSAKRDLTTMTFENLAMIVFAPLQGRALVKVRKMAKKMSDAHLFVSVSNAMSRITV